MKVAQRGGMMIFAALLIIPLLGFILAAIDVGRVYSVRGELQNAADASSLAGANCLALRTGASAPRYTSTCGTPSGTNPLQWPLAQAKATGHLGQNKSEAVAIASTGNTVEVGYWDIVNKVPTGGGSSLSTTPGTLGANDYPAVRVVVKRDSNVSNGPMMLFTRLLSGILSVNLSAQAVAIIAPPSEITPGNVIPVVINKCMFDLFWDSTNNQPKIYSGPSSTPADPYGLSTAGSPYTIRIGSSYHYGACTDAGQWTTFDNFSSSSASVVNALIKSGNTNPLSIGQSVALKPGTVTSQYNDLGTAYTGKDVNLLVVTAPNNDLSTNGSATITAFAGFHIDNVVGGSGKYIQGHFIKSNVIAGGTGIGGSFFGTYEPPVLAR